MNEQQLQQILTIQQAIAAAATAAVINSLLNPQQAALNNSDANASNDLQQQLQQLQQQQQQIDARLSPLRAASSSPASNHHNNNNNNNHNHNSNTNQNDNGNARIQELLLQLQQQAAAGNGIGGVGGLQLSPLNAAASALNLNLNRSNINNSNSSPPISSRLINQQQQHHATGFKTSPVAASATTSGNIQPSIQIPPNKKLKRHNQQQQPTSSPAQQQFSQPQQKNRSSLDATNSSSSSNTFLSNNVGLPRKLVRGQDVWLGRGAEQTRQILKCMWCGQSFRTLAEMTQHMKITQHYTNIISQEQITSWRQPEGSDTSSNKTISNTAKQSVSAQFRELEDNNDDFTDDSDSNISNEEMLNTNPQQIKGNRRNNKSTDLRTSRKRDLSTPATDSSSTAGSVKDEVSPSRAKDSLHQISVASAKPLTRSKRREHQDHTKPSPIPPATKSANSTKTTNRGGENSPTPLALSSPSSSSSQHQRLNNNNSAVLSDLNEDSEANRSEKNIKIEDGEDSQELTKSSQSNNHTTTDQEDADKELENSIKRFVEDELLAKQEEEELKLIQNDKIKKQNENKTKTTDEDDISATDFSLNNISDKYSKEEGEVGCNLSGKGTVDVDEDEQNNDAHENDDVDDVEDEVEIRYKNDDDCGDVDIDHQDESACDMQDNDSDNRISSTRCPQVKESRQAISVGAASIDATKSVTTAGHTGEGGNDPDDPLSALETMVEKSFDPRLRPGVANGGILQRLGIDEEVCPPWQHINYANWYAAAAYGHPMAAALLAAGINLQNGIKLSKNVGPKKGDE